MEIRRATGIPADTILGRNFSFTVTEEIAACTYTTICGRTLVTRPVLPYLKDNGADPDEFRDISGPDRALFVLAQGDAIFGYALARKSWNRMVGLEDIALDTSVRARGHGKRLVETVIDWARDQGVDAVRAETQSTNVAACRLYKACGFELGGYDKFLYRGIPEHRTAVALYWYYLFR